MYMIHIKSIMHILWRLIKFLKICLPDISEAMKKDTREQNKIITISRVGDSFHYKALIGDIDVDFSEKLGEQTGWEEKEKNPVFHIRVS